MKREPLTPEHIAAAAAIIETWTLTHPADFFAAADAADAVLPAGYSIDDAAIAYPYIAAPDFACYCTPEFSVRLNIVRSMRRLID